MNFWTRNAKKEDLPAVLDLINELADFEKALNEVLITLEELERDGFSENPLYKIIVAENESAIIGMSFYYIRYSTWKGKCLYLEDLIVKEAFRRQQVGEALFTATVNAAKEMNAKLMTWQVLDWNEPAIKFYEKFGAELDGEWVNGKLTFEPMNNK